VTSSFKPQAAAAALQQLERSRLAEDPDPENYTAGEPFVIATKDDKNNKG
jgi:hypothetical protein